MSEMRELKACPTCGADCRVETSRPTEIMPEAMKLWVCSNHPRFGGGCTHDLAYFDADTWNTRTLSTSLDQEGLVEKVARAIWDAQYESGTSWDDWDYYIAENPGSFDGRDTSRELVRADLLAIQQEVGE